MLYASIVLVAAGIALIAYSIITRGRAQASLVSGTAAQQTGNRGRDNDGVRGTGSGREERSTAHPLPEAVQPAAREMPDTGGEPEKPAARTAPKPSAPPARQERPKPSTAPAAKTAQVPGTDDAGNADTAVLYNDASGVVDYESRENVIDPSFKKYSKLRRVGRGHVGIVKDGINFQLRKKLYRFEFYRIEKMLPGKNYIALFIKGSDEAKLLIFDRESTMERRLMNEFRAYRKGSM